MGSSSVMMWSGRVWFIVFKIDASVVDLPEPVSPVTSMMPFWYDGKSITMGGRPSDPSSGMRSDKMRIARHTPRMEW